MKDIIGWHLAMILLALIAIFGFIYLESIDLEKYLQMETNAANNNHLRSIKSTSMRTPPTNSKSVEGNDTFDINDGETTRTNLNSVEPIPTKQETKLPFHIDDNTIFCFEIEGLDDKYVMIKYNYNKIEYWVSKTPEWNAKTNPTNTYGFQFDNVKNQIRMKWSTAVGWKGYSVKTFWQMDINSNEFNHTKIPIKIILQRLSVLDHFQNYKNDQQFRDLPVPILEDVQTLATMCMMAYQEQVMGITHYQDQSTNTHYYNVNGMDNQEFYGGEIVKVNPINTVEIDTDLPSPNNIKISVGPLLVYAWSNQNVFVVAFRGTHFNQNWSINFKCKAKKIMFRTFAPKSRSKSRGMMGDIHSGMYDVINGYLDDFMKVFDGYKGEKRIIFTGHSLGSGLAQVMLLHLLDVNNKGRLTPEVNDIIYGNSGVSFEYVGFGGPAIMDQGLATALKAALDDFNDRGDDGMISKPDPNYSALLVTKANDPVSWQGDAAKKFAEETMDEWIKTPSQLVVRSRLTKVGKALLRAGLNDLLRYQHFGKVIEVDTTPARKKLEYLFVQAHGTYLAADTVDIMNHGIKGWVN